MTGLLGVGGDKLIAQRIALGRPVLGICVGMQVLFGTGVEHGIATDGCGVWPGVVERLDSGTLPLPHMGWNMVCAAGGSRLFAGIAGGYPVSIFVHSYAVQSWTEPADAGVSWTTHGSRFVAAVECGVVSATQFHPEKSGDAGAALLSNW